MPLPKHGILESSCGCWNRMFSGSRIPVSDGKADTVADGKFTGTDSVFRTADIEKTVLFQGIYQIVTGLHG